MYIHIIYILYLLLLRRGGDLWQDDSEHGAKGSGRSGREQGLAVWQGKRPKKSIGSLRLVVDVDGCWFLNCHNLWAIKYIPHFQTHTHTNMYVCVYIHIIYIYIIIYIWSLQTAFWVALRLCCRAPFETMSYKERRLTRMASADKRYTLLTVAVAVLSTKKVTESLPRKVLYFATCSLSHTTTSNNWGGQPSLCRQLEFW